MKLLGVCIVYLAISAVSMSADLQGFSSAEAAFEAHERARTREDIAAFLATINFRQGAMETLQRAREELTETNIDQMAVKQEAEVRQHLQSRGFTKYGRCKVATKFQDSETQVRFILSCTDATGGTTFPVRVMRFTTGWLVVRGG
jgi:phage-related protein